MTTQEPKAAAEAIKPEAPAPKTSPAVKVARKKSAAAPKAAAKPAVNSAVKPAAKEAPAAKKVTAKKVAVKKVASEQAAPAAKKLIQNPVVKPTQKPAQKLVQKPAKDKLVRDSFTMPRSDFALIDQLKERALGFKRPTKKSELLRAGLQVLAGLTDAKLAAVLAALTTLQAGRPKGSSK